MSEKPTLAEMLQTQRYINQRLQDGVPRSPETDKAQKSKGQSKSRKKVTDNADTSRETGAEQTDSDE